MFRAKSVDRDVDRRDRDDIDSRRDRDDIGSRGRGDVDLGDRDYVGRRDREDAGRRGPDDGGRHGRRGVLAGRESRRPMGRRGGSPLASGAAWFARVVRLVAAVVALIIVVGILLVVLDANPTNSIASAIHDAARWLVGPFDGLFSFDSAKVALAVNWGIAAVVYLAVAVLIVRLLRRARR